MEGWRSSGVGMDHVQEQEMGMEGWRSSREGMDQVEKQWGGDGLDGGAGGSMVHKE